MSTRYNIDGKVYTADYMRDTYRKYFEKALEVFNYYFNLNIPIHLKKISVIIPSETSGISSDSTKGPLDQDIIVNSELHLKLKTGPTDISVYDILHTSPAHEAAEGIFYHVRLNLDKPEVATKKVGLTKQEYVFYRVFSEMFSEIYCTIFCDTTDLKFTPLPEYSWFSRVVKRKRESPEFKAFYGIARGESKLLRHESIEFRVAFLRALLFQRFDPLEEDITISIKKEFRKAFDYARKRA